MFSGHNRIVQENKSLSIDNMPCNHNMTVNKSCWYFTASISAGNYSEFNV